MLRRDAPEQDDFSDMGAAFFHSTRRSLPMPIHRTAVMKLPTFICFIACVLFFLPSVARPDESPEVEKAIAAARAGKIDDAASLLSAAVEKNSDQARWLLARLH